EGNTTMKVVIARPDNRMYKDLAEGRKTEQREFFGRKFLIQDELDAFSWKLTGEQKTLLEYPCFRAVHEEEDRVVEAWFTPQIPVSTGPGIYGQLPGMVLEVSVNDGQRKIQATKVTFTEVSADQLEKPKKGKEVTQEEFDQIEAEKMKEMEEQGGGRMMIRIGN
ncbi:MAG: GLPGLI family protein, partial [Saprospiraceae bacterium]|nr:GLPGLI family protein [Saprospiraceae bacterium]